MPRVMSAVNWVLIAFSGLALLWRFYVMVRPFPIDARDTIRGILTAPITMAVYAVVLGAGFVFPLGGYLLAGGAALGLGLGALTRIKVEDGIATGKRATLYLLIWGLILLLTQWLGTAVGDAGVAAGLTLMLFPMAMGATQDLLVMSRARRAVARAARLTPGLTAGTAMLLVGAILAASLLFPASQCQAAIRFPGEDWVLAAAREYNRAGYAKAYELAGLSVDYFGNYYKGEAKAQAELVAAMASEKLGNGRAAAWRTAAEATLRTRYSTNESAATVSASIATAMDRLQAAILATSRGEYTLRTDDVVYVQGLGAIYRQDIPELWARYGHLLEQYKDNPLVAALLKSLMPVIMAMAEAKPVSPTQAAVAAVATPVVLAGATVLDLRALAELARRRRELGAGVGALRGTAAGKPGAGSSSQAGESSSPASPEVLRLGNALHGHLAKAVEAGADLPLSLTEWQPDRPSWLDLVRRAVEKFMEYEDQIEAAGEVKELFQEVTQGDELAVLAMSRLAAAARHLHEKGVLKADHPLVTRFDDLAGRLGPKGVKAVLAATDAAGQDLPAAATAMVDAVKSLSGE